MRGDDFIISRKIILVISIVLSYIMTTLFFTTYKLSKIKKALSNLFLLNKFNSQGTKYKISKCLMLIYIFLMFTILISSTLNRHVEITNLLIIGLGYPLIFRMFFNGSYSK